MKSSISCKQFFAKDIILSRVMLNTCKHVLDESEDTLIEYKKSFLESSGVTSHGSLVGSSQDKGSISALGSAPPTGTFSELTSFEKLVKVPSTVFERVTKKDDFTDLKKEVSDNFLADQGFGSSVQEAAQRRQV